MSVQPDALTVEGIVMDTLPNAFFTVQLDEGDRTVLAHVSGKMRMRNIRVTLSDRVVVEMSPYDLTRGRITWVSREGNRSDGRRGTGRGKAYRRK